MILQIQEFGICSLSLVPLRAEASDKSEMLSQLLFGDLLSILEKTEKWTRIKTEYDDYEGWIDNKQYAPISFDEFNAAKHSMKTLPLKAVFAAICSASSEKLYLTAGSSIPFLENKRFKVNGRFYELAEDPLNTDKADFRKNVAAVSSFYLGAPYLWGGRSVFGIDCSGFVQMVLKQFHIRIKRDAWQQAEQGSEVDDISESRTGDLAFFDNSEGRVVHVGIILDHAQIIHASGRVRIDKFDKEGIYNEELKRHTHKLCGIRRFSS